MNVLADSAPAAEISFPDALLNVAQWLDSQDIEHQISDARELGINVCNLFVIRQEWEETMCSSRLFDPRYYDPSTTNSERVLAVLMLREMILSGDL